MTRKQTLKEAKAVRKYVLFHYHDKPCKTLNADCPNCKATILLAYLNWFIDLEEWALKNPL